MKIKPRSFPYPVLSGFSDDISPNGFGILLDVTATKSAFELEFDVSFEYREFEDLITNKVASLIIHIECISNFYRNAFRSSELKGNISIPSSELNGRVEVTFLVVADKQLSKYQLNGFHSDYGEICFSINKADVLGLLETKYFIAEKDPNVLKRISSIIQITKLETGKTNWEIDLEHPKILIRMSMKDMENYNRICKVPEVSSTLMSTIVIPVLIEALQRIRETNEIELEGMRELRWFSVLEKKLELLDIDLKNTGNSLFEIAQKIMEFPASRMLNELDILTSTGD